MKTRILTAVIAVPVVFCVLFVLPQWTTAVMMAIIALISVLEVYNAFAVYARENKKSQVSVLLPSVVICVAIALSLGLSIYSLRDSAFGRYLVLLPFICAFITDGGAYFVGVTLGKRKIFPKISPKKSLEGCIGGIVIGTLAVVGYTFLLSRVIPGSLGGVDAYSGYTFNYLNAAIIGLIGAAATEAGDLLFSAIKRKLGIKDYGNLIPGHGGMLDRFDSMVVCAPVVASLCVLLPIFEVWIA